MTEPTFREIQLTKKQLVFLFMAMVVLAAVVFLLGVSLGRRLPAKAQASQPADEVADVVSTADMPPPTVLTPDDRKYATELQGSDTVPPPGAVAPPPPATDPAPAPSASAPTPAAVAPPVAAPLPAPAAAAATSKPAPKASAVSSEPPAPVAGGWFVQVNAFRSRENAESEVRQLKGKGYAAFVSPGGSLFRVRVGPLSTRPEADKTAVALRRAGFNPSITR